MSDSADHPGETEDPKLAAVEDAYGGVVVQQEALLSDAIEFRNQLSQSIEVRSNCP